MEREGNRQCANKKKQKISSVMVKKRRMMKNREKKEYKEKNEIQILLFPYGSNHLPVGSFSAIGAFEGSHVVVFLSHDGSRSHLHHRMSRRCRGRREGEMKGRIESPGMRRVDLRIIIIPLMGRRNRSSAVICSSSSSSCSSSSLFFGEGRIGE